MASNLQIIINGVDHASGTFDDVGSAMDSLTGKSKGLLSAGLGPLQSMLGGALKVSLAGAAAGVGALAAGLGSSISDAADFQQSMADIQASMGASAEDTAKLKDLILDLGIDPKLKVSAQEAAQAIGQLGTAGVSIDDILKGTARSTVLLANATGADFADAASIASDVSKLWSIDAGNLTHAVNGITAATVASKFNINDYRLALAQAGGVASTVGVNFDDFNATIAAISPSFASGSDAGTSFKVFLQRLIPQSTKAQDSMGALGLITTDWAKAAGLLAQKLGHEVEPNVFAVTKAHEELLKSTQGIEPGTKKAKDAWKSFIATFKQNQFFEANGQMKDMSQIVGVLNKAFAGLTEEEKNQQLSIVFGTDAMRAAAAMAKMTTGDFEGLAATMAKTDAAESAKTRMDTLKGSLEILSGTFDTLKLMVGDKFLPVLNDLVKRFNDFLGAQAPTIVEWAGQLATKFGDLANTWLPSLVSGFKIGIDIAGVLVGRFIAIAKEVSWLAQVFAQSGFDGLFKVFEDGSSHVDGLLESFGVAESVAMALGSVLAHLGQTLVDLGRYLFFTAQDGDFLNDWLSHLPSFIKPAVMAIGGIIEILRTTAIEIVNWVNGNQSGFDAVQHIWENVLTVGEVLFGRLIDFVKSNLPAWTATLQAWGTAAWSWIKDVTPVALAKLGEWLTALTGWVLGHLPSWLAALGQWAIAMTQWIINTIPGTIDAFSKWLDGLLGWGDTTGRGQFGNMLVTFGNAMMEQVAPVMGKLALALIEAFIKMQISLVAATLKLGIDIIFGLAQGLLNFAGIDVSLQGLHDHLFSIIDNWKNVMQGAGAAIMDFFRNGLLSGQNNVRNGLDVVMDFIQQGRDARLPAFQQSLYDAGNNAIAKLGQGFTSAQGFVSGQFSQIMNDVQNQGAAFATGALAGRMLQTGLDIIGNLARGFSQSAPGVRSGLDAAFNGVNEALNYWQGNLAPHFAASAKDLLASITNAFVNSNFAQGLNNAFIGLRDMFNQWHDDLLPHFFSMAGTLGKALIDGLSGAIKNGAKDAIAAIQGATDALPQWVKDKLGIHSPSTVFAGLGQNIIEGLVQGMQSMAGAPQAVLSDMTAGMMLGASGGSSVIDNSQRNVTHQWNVSIPTAGGNQPTDQMQSMFNTLTTIYAR